MTSRADYVARTVLDQFQKLPAKRKPCVRDNGLHEWVPLSGLVVETDDGQFTCVALATGMKCLPAQKIPLCRGVGLHDWHAEVLALRTFNRFLLDECEKLLKETNTSSILELIDCSSNVPSLCSSQPFRLKPGLQLHMYCSEAPCGDASMELTMAAQEDDTPWTLTAGHEDYSAADSTLLGRGHFSQLGIVRRKPARADAPATLSKSCSDKLAAKQCLSILSSITSLFIEPSDAYLTTLVVPEGRFSKSACDRAFGSDGRMEPLQNKRWSPCYDFRPFTVMTTALDFEFSKTAAERRSNRISASNLAAAWSFPDNQETIINGVLQGRKAFDAKGASRCSRRSMWEAARALAGLLAGRAVSVGVDVNAAIYKDIKAKPDLGTRRQVKADIRETALSGWVRNEGDSNFSLTS